MRFLIADSEPPEARRSRRESVGRSSGESYRDGVADLVPDAVIDRIAPADADASLPHGTALGDYDAVFLTGSPLHLYEETPETRRQVEFMRAVFGSGTPSFGSCAGLQVATVAAGGRVRSKPAHEAAFARNIAPTELGRDHPLLTGRPDLFDALAIHADEVEALPEGAILLAANADTTVQAAEIRSNGGTFWGVQYHPELSLAEIAAALRRQADDLVGEGLADSREALESEAALIEALGREPDRADLAARLGVDAEITDPARRELELTNFVDRLVRPTRSARSRE